MVRSGALIFLTGCFGAAALCAQQSPAPSDSIVVQGEVLDATSGRPLTGTLVVLHDVWKITRTDQLGYFSFEGVPVGAHELGVYALGYLTVEEYLDFVPDEVYAVNLEPAPIEIEGFDVEVLSPEEREYRSFGQRYDFVGPERMEEYREKYIHITDVLRARLPGVFVTDGGGLNSRLCVRNTRGTTTTYGGESSFGCALMFIDGMQATPQDVSALHLEEIGSVRYLARLEARLVYGEIGRHGVLLIETRSGRRE